jgi:SNF2 family DNA or RNA helicase
MSISSTLEVHNPYYNGSSILENSTPWSSKSFLQTIDLSFRNLLTETSPHASQPKEITVPLRPHQKALVYEMAEREKKSIEGIPYQNTITYANYGVLGDEVGTGKSLTVLSYIAALKHKDQLVQIRNILYQKSTKHLFTVYKREYNTLSKASLIVVPHIIYRQWQTYCKTQTTLSVFYIKSQKDLKPMITPYENSDSTEEQNAAFVTAKNAFMKQCMESDVVLISNTLYSDLQRIAEMQGIQWKRVFVDEVDSIYISGGSIKLDAPFVWFISATWQNFVLDGYFIRPSMLDIYTTNSDCFTSELGTWLREEIGTGAQTTHTNHSGRTTSLRTRSSRWLEDFRSDHVLRAMTVLTCCKEFIQASRQMPPIIDTILLCEQPITHRVLQGVVTSAVQYMLHAGNIEGALQELGVSKDTSMNLIEAVTLEREKELDRLQKTFQFKQTMEYATPQAKESSLASLQSKIYSIEEQLKTFRERLLNIQVEECPICYENPNDNSGTLTPCCHRIFCGSCILHSLSRAMTCPMCRAVIRPAELIQLVKTNKAASKDVTTKLLSKQKQLLHFLKENPTARVLVFSRYENPFLALESSCETEGITYHVLRGNKDTIASTIRSFEKGEKRVLFLPTESAGAGLNLVSATHVLLYHAMTSEEEKQLIGRAYRLGRKEPLHVIRLLHEGETLIQQQM